MTDDPKPAISAEEMQRRRAHVRTAIADSRIEGLPPPTSPELEIFEAYIRGEIEAADLVTAYRQRANHTPPLTHILCRNPPSNERKRQVKAWRQDQIFYCGLEYSRRTGEKVNTATSRIFENALHNGLYATFRERTGCPVDTTSRKGQSPVHKQEHSPKCTRQHNRQSLSE